MQYGSLARLSISDPAGIVSAKVFRARLRNTDRNLALT